MAYKYVRFCPKRFWSEASDDGIHWTPLAEGCYQDLKAKKSYAQQTGQKWFDADSSHKQATQPSFDKLLRPLPAGDAFKGTKIPIPRAIPLAAVESSTAKIGTYKGQKVIVLSRDYQCGKAMVHYDYSGEAFMIDIALLKPYTEPVVEPVVANPGPVFAFAGTKCDCGNDSLPEGKRGKHSNYCAKYSTFGD